MPFLCKRMIRTKVKGTKFKAASSPEQEPDFYAMPPLVPSVTSDEDMSHDSDPSQSTESQMQPSMNPFEPISWDLPGTGGYIVATPESRRLFKAATASPNCNAPAVRSVKPQNRLTAAAEKDTE
jgi:hypothetical protein